jgi:hypothetical protein
MTEKDQIHTLLADLAGEDPPVDIDLDRQIQRGQRRVRRRTVAICLTALAVPVIFAGGIVALRPDSNRSDAPAADSGTPTVSSTTPRMEEHTGSTEKSRALLAQVRSVIPELADTPGARMYDMEMVLGTEDTLHAGADWLWPKELIKSRSTSRSGATALCYRCATARPARTPAPRSGTSRMDRSPTCTQGSCPPPRATTTAYGSIARTASA